MRNKIAVIFFSLFLTITVSSCTNNSAPDSDFEFIESGIESEETYGIYHFNDGTDLDLPEIDEGTDDIDSTPIENGLDEEIWTPTY